MNKLRLTLIFASIALTSCYRDDFFELKNPPEFPWQSVKEFEMAVVAPYNKYFFGDWGGSYMTDRVIRDGMTEILYLIPGSAEDFPHDEIYYRSTNIRNTRADQCFANGYKAINNLNSSMDFFYNPERYFSDPTKHPFYNLSSSKQLELHRQIGEMHIFRAFCYFQHLIRHCPSPGSSGYSSKAVLPFRKDWTFNADSMRHPEIVSAKKIMDEIIIPDLRVARAWLPNQYTAANHPSYQYGRPAKYAAYGISARIFFYLGNESYTMTDGTSFNPWDSALIYSEAVINSGIYNLNEEPIKAFNRSTASLAAESIWDVIHYNTEYKDAPWDATLFTWNHGNVVTSNPDYLAAMPYGSVPAQRDDDSLYLMDVRKHRCTWHVFSMSFSTAQYIDWIDASDSSQTLNATMDKRFKQLYLYVKPAPLIEDEVINASPFILYDNKNTWVRRPQIWCNKYFRGAQGDLTNVPVLRLPEMYLTAAIIEKINGKNDGGLSKTNTIRVRAGLGALGAVTEEDIHKERIKELAFEGDWLIYLYGLRKNIGPGDRVDRSEIPIGDDRLQWQLPLEETQFYE